MPWSEFVAGRIGAEVAASQREDDERDRERRQGRVDAMFGMFGIGKPGG